MSALFDGGRAGLMDHSISWLEDEIGLAIVGPTWTPDLSADAILSDLPAGSVWAQFNPLSGKYITANGAADADDVLIDYVTTVGKIVSRLVLYQMHPLNDFSTSPTYRLLAMLDEGDGIGGVSTGGPILIRWPDTPDYIFRI
jgi:hypothetical protein